MNFLSGGRLLLAQEKTCVFAAPQALSKWRGAQSYNFGGKFWLTLINHGMEGVSTSSDCRPWLSASRKWMGWIWRPKWWPTTSSSWRRQRCFWVAADPNNRFVYPWKLRIRRNHIGNGCSQWFSNIFKFQFSALLVPLQQMMEFQFMYLYNIYRDTWVTFPTRKKITHTTGLLQNMFFVVKDFEECHR